MNPYNNLPRSQHTVQHFIDLFNSDERVWRALEKRRRRRQRLLRLTKKQHRALDRLEFAATRPPDDCIAQSW